MPAINLYLKNSLDAQGWCSLSEATQAANTTASGWTVSTGALQHSELESGVERAASTFVLTLAPDGSLDTTLKDAFRSENPYNGSFASANWEFHGVVRAVTNGGAQDGRVRFRLIKADADGSNATEITSGQQQGAAVSNVSTSADFDSNLTFNPGAFSITNQYLFLQIAWERTGAGGMTTADILFRTGSSSSAGTRIVTATFTPAAQTVSAAGAIGTGEAFGTAALDLTLLGAGGVASGEAFGGPAVDFTLTSVGNIATAEAFGSAIVDVATMDLQISGAGAISSLEAFGTTALDFTLRGVGAVASGEAFGSPGLDFTLKAAGAIASAEIFGSPGLDLTVRGAGAIASLEAFGSPALDFTLKAAGAIATAETFGASTVSLADGDLQISGAGAISSLEAFGTTALDFTLRGVGGIASSEAVSGPSLDFTLKAAGGIITGEAFGSPELGFIIRGVGAISSAETFGAGRVDKQVLSVEVLPYGLPLVEPAASPGVVTSQPAAALQIGGSGLGSPMISDD